MQKNVTMTDPLEIIAACDLNINRYGKVKEEMRFPLPWLAIHHSDQNKSLLYCKKTSVVCNKVLFLSKAQISGER